MNLSICRIQYGMIHLIYVMVIFAIIIIYEDRISRLQHFPNASSKIKYPIKYINESDIRNSNSISTGLDHKQLLLGLLPKWDFTRLVNFEPFRFEKFNKVCDDSTILLILIHSAPTNIERRKAVRATWGRKREDVKILFLFGAVTVEAQEKILDEEDYQYNDILQANFIDSYRNITYKHVMGLKYAVYYCPQTRYILKVDDDTFVNIPMALKFFKNKFQLCGIEDLIQCKMIYNRTALRAFKWGVSFEEFPAAEFPDFCMGAGIIYSWEMAYKLYTEAQKGEFFWIDDVHITGTLAKRFKIVQKDLGRYAILQEEIKDIIESNGTKGQTDFIFGVYDLTPETIIKLGAALENKIYDKNIKLLPEKCVL